MTSVGRIKICGVRRAGDALLAARAGADAVGVLVGQRHASGDFVTPAEARAIFAALPPYISAVLVTHVGDAAAVADLLAETGADTVQLHGDTPPEGCRLLRSLAPHARQVKCVHVSDAASLEAARPYFTAADALLLDTANAATNQVGGTGLTHDWTLSAALVLASPLPVVLAGGLRPENVGAAIARVRPWAVDVNSGVKGADGFKDAGRLAAFVAAARAGFAGLSA